MTLPIAVTCPVRRAMSPSTQSVAAATVNSANARSLRSVGRGRIHEEPVEERDEREAQDRDDVRDGEDVPAVVDREVVRRRAPDRWPSRHYHQLLLLKNHSIPIAMASIAAMTDRERPPRVDGRPHPAR